MPDPADPTASPDPVAPLTKADLALASASPRSISRLRLTDEEAQRALTLDLKMIFALRKIARGEPLLDLPAKRALKREWAERLAALDLTDELRSTIFDLVMDAFTQGASTTIDPRDVVKAIETIVRIGHKKLWTPPESDAKESKSVTINILSVERDKAKELAQASVPANGASVVETTTVGEK